MRTTAATALAAALVVGVFVGGCRKRAGSSCKPGEVGCLDKTTALACHGGKLVEVACAGPLGCTKYAGKASCDDSVANVGDPCMNDGDDELACSPDKKTAAICRNGRFERHLTCRGSGGCALLGRTLSCDASIAEKGDPCKEQGALACDVDRKHMLVCRDGKFDVHRYCRGQYGCQLKNDIATCDQSLSLEQDPCGLPGQVVCSVDGQTELVCQGSTFLRSRSCKKSGCVVTSRPGRPIECN